MTNEQWLVYIWSIYPNGGFQVFWAISLIMVVALLTFAAINYFSDISGYRYSEEEKDTYIWIKLGKWKIIVPLVLLLFFFLSNFVPSREHFAYIIATPYAVESGKSIVESLNDPSSKLSKLNQMTDKALDKALLYLDDDKKDKQSKPEEKK